MVIPIIIPKEGQSTESALIIKWNVKKGSRVEFGDSLCEVETEKVSFEIESPIKGIVLEILYPEGTEVPVQVPIAFIEEEGEVPGNEAYSEIKGNKSNEENNINTFSKEAEQKEIKEF